MLKASTGCFMSLRSMRGFLIDLRIYLHRTTRCARCCASRSLFWAIAVPGDQEVITRYTAAIEEFLGGKVQVIGKVIADVPGSAGDRVSRPPGARLNIAEVHFIGNDVLPTATLVSALSQVAVGVPYSDATMHQLLDGCARARNTKNAGASA